MPTLELDNIKYVDSVSTQTRCVRCGNKATLEMGIHDKNEKLWRCQIKCTVCTYEDHFESPRFNWPDLNTPGIIAWQRAKAQDKVWELTKKVT